MEMDKEMNATLVKTLDENLNLHSFILKPQDSQFTQLTAQLAVFMEDRPDVTPILGVVHSLNTAIKVGTDLLLVLA